MSCEGTSTFDLSDSSLMKILLETHVEKVAIPLINKYLGVGFSLQDNAIHCLLINTYMGYKGHTGLYDQDMASLRSHAVNTTQMVGYVQYFSPFIIIMIFV